MSKRAKVFLVVLVLMRLLAHPVEHAFALQVQPSAVPSVQRSELHLQQPTAPSDVCALCQTSHSFSTLEDIFLPFTDAASRLERPVACSAPTWFFVPDHSPRGPPLV